MALKVLIVGGSRGIGRKIAEDFANEGADIFFTYMASHVVAEDLSSMLHTLGSARVAKYCFDAGQPESIGVYEEILAQSGGVDVLVNCAGITRDRTLKKMSITEWDDVIRTNLYSVFYSCKAVMPVMMEQGFGRIINISSVIGQTGNFGQSNYAASKAAIIGFTKSIALECAKYDVTANVVCPGFIDTEMTKAMPDEIKQNICARIPKRQFGMPEDVSDAVLYLAREGSRYVTGQVINVNGGLYM